MKLTKRTIAIAMGASLALSVAACGGGDDEGSGSTDDKTASGTVIIGHGQPENPLVPANTTETNGGTIIDWVFSGLVGYANDGGKPYNLLAESIETKDSKVYTVKIKKDTKFHDGTVVKAKNFVDAWNFSAYSPNAMQNASFFSDIAGFADVNTEDPDGEGPQKAPEPKAKEMSGLKVVDDFTFEITLNAPFAIFPTKLGYSVFKPLPDAFFTQGAEKFGRSPIGNGPLKFVSWTDNQEIKLTRFDDYNLSNKSAVKDVVFKMYQDENAQYNDLLSNKIDYMQQVPPSSLAASKWKTDLGDRAKEAPVPTTGIIAFPMYDKRFQNVHLRKAVSLAIDRAQINEKIFFGTRPPATSWSNPLAPGSSANDCTVCKFDATAAKAELQQAGGFTGKMTFFYNADSGHKDWMEALAQSVKNTLGIDAVAEGIPTFAETRKQINEHKMTGPYRAAWQEDYPDVENWIGPLYVTGGSSNDGLYSNKEVDRLYKEATSAASVDDAHAKFAEAVKLIDADVPAMPIYYYSQQWGISTNLKKAEATWVGNLDLATVELG